MLHQFRNAWRRSRKAACWTLDDPLGEPGLQLANLGKLAVPGSLVGVLIETASVAALFEGEVPHKPGVRAVEAHRGLLLGCRVHAVTVGHRPPHYHWSVTTLDSIRRGRTCVFALHVHLVFVTKYRRGVFEARHLDAMQPVMAKVCADFDAELVEFNGEDDHVHLLVEYPPTVQLSRLVNSLKGVSSRRLRQQFGRRNLRTHQDHLWSPSYFAASCGGAPIEVVRQYVEQQRRPN